MRSLLFLEPYLHSYIIILRSLLSILLFRLKGLCLCLQIINQDSSKNIKRMYFCLKVSNNVESKIAGWKVDEETRLLLHGIITNIL